MGSPDSETIFALSSGALPSGVAVVRFSGPAAFEVNKRLSGSDNPSRRALLRPITDDENDQKIDQALVLSFPGPHSFTGEDVVEWHCHGGRATLRAVLELLGRQTGFRLAEPGEFSRRSFENGKMDFTQLEGLADLISAQTENQRKQALSQSEGGLHRLYDQWRTELIRYRALIEAELDFADEEDIPGSVSDRIWSEVTKLVQSINTHLDDANQGQIIRDGLQVALTGPPNAGKSSLLNALAKRDVAIVTDQAGTTRDVIEVALEMDGYLVRLFDTAGVRETEDVVEKEGIRRTLQTAEQADLILWLSPPGDQSGQAGFENAVVLRSKADLAGELLHEKSASAISVKTKDGLEPVLKVLRDRLARFSQQEETPSISRIRQRKHLEDVVIHLEQSLMENRALELRSEDLRRAGDCLGRITGKIDVEDLLDVIFSEFCVGK